MSTATVQVAIVTQTAAAVAAFVRMDVALMAALTDVVKDAVTIAIRVVYVKFALDAWINHTHFLLYNRCFLILITIFFMPKKS